MKIEKPIHKTFFICREDENFTITAYGSIGPENVMETAQPIVETYLDKTEWEVKLLEGGIDISIKQPSIDFVELPIEFSGDTTSDIIDEEETNI